MQQKDLSHIEIRLNKDVALILFEWLVINREKNDAVVGEETPLSADEIALDTLEAALEPLLEEIFSPNYRQLVAEARARLIGTGGGNTSSSDAGA